MFFAGQMMEKMLMVKLFRGFADEPENATAFVNVSTVFLWDDVVSQDTFDD